jgi:hypothetical protein
MGQRTLTVPWSHGHLKCPAIGKAFVLPLCQQANKGYVVVFWEHADLLHMMAELSNPDRISSSLLAKEKVLLSTRNCYFNTVLSLLPWKLGRLFTSY